jgi:hypothetical protein
MSWASGCETPRLVPMWLRVRTPVPAGAADRCHFAQRLGRRGFVM